MNEYRIKIRENYQLYETKERFLYLFDNIMKNNNYKHIVKFEIKIDNDDFLFKAKITYLGLVFLSWDIELYYGRNGLSLDIEHNALYNSDFTNKIRYLYPNITYLKNNKGVDN